MSLLLAIVALAGAVTAAYRLIGWFARALVDAVDHAGSVADLDDPLTDRQLRELRRRHGIEEIHRA